MSLAGSLLLIAAGWLAGWLLGWRRHPLPSAPVPVRVPFTVVIPARNEERSLPLLLARLAGARPAPMEVLVVDDGSTDATAALARAAGCRVLTVAPPVGWTGKAWACWQGAQAAQGEVVVFLDADTDPGPAFVADLAGTAVDAGGLVSVQPWHRVVRPYEHLSAFCNLVSLLGAGTGHRPVAFGPALAIERARYLALGGHGAVRDRVAEDLALAVVATGAGVPVMAFGEGDIRYRMYPEGVTQLAEGWTKNLGLGAATLSRRRLILVVVWICACVQASVLPAQTAMSIPSLIAYGAVVAQLAILWRRVGGFGLLTAVLFPIPLLGFVILFVRSWWLTKVMQRVVWRGRSLEPV